MAANPEIFSPFIVGVGGTARHHSTSEMAVAHSLRSAEQIGARTQLFDGDFLSNLPMYKPGRWGRNAAEQAFIEAVRKCDGVIVGTPGYHGGLSGPVKNILDLLEDTVDDERAYLQDRAFGCIVTAHGWQACGTTLVSLRMIAHALRAWPTPYGVILNTSSPLFDVDGSCSDQKTSAQLQVVAQQVVDFARWRAQACRDHAECRSIERVE